MFIGKTFNVNEIPEQENNFDPLPAGWYTTVIAGAELKTTKAGNGQFISVRYDVTGPSHQGRVVFGNINISNPNPKAEEIGHQQFGSLLRAIGLTACEDTDQLIGGNCEIKLTVTQSEQYGPGNDIKGFKSMTGSIAPTSSPTQAAPAAARPPWQK